MSYLPCAYASATPFWRRWCDGEDIKAVSHLGRTIPDRLKTAAVGRDPICVVPGCGEHEGLDIEHITPVHRRGRTLRQNLCRLGEWHHYLKTHHG